MAEGHRKRLIDKVLENSFDSFEQHEFMELFLFMLLPRVNTNKIAHELIDKYGSFCQACNAPVSELVKINGIGEQTAKRIKHFAKLVSHYRMSIYSDNIKIDNDNILGAYAVELLGGKKTQKVYAFCMNSRNELLNCYHIADVSDICNVEPKTVIERIINTSTTQLIIAFNHPDGLLVATDKDIAFITELKRALKNMGITLRNAIIVSNNVYDFVGLSSRK